MATRMRLWMAIGVAIGVGPMSGCATFEKPQPRHEATPRPSDVAVQAAMSGQHEPRRVESGAPDEATIAAIEQFLERTRDYAEPPAPDHRHTAASGIDGSRQAPPRDADRDGGAGLTRPRSEAALAGVHHARSTLDSPSLTGAPTAAPAARGAWTNGGGDAPRRGLPQPTGSEGGARSMATTGSVASRLPLPAVLAVSVREAPEMVASDGADAGMSNVAVDVVARSPAAAWEVLIEALRQEAEASANVRVIWQLALAELASKPLQQPQLAMSGHSAETRLLLEALLQAATAVRDLLIDPMGAAGDSLDRVEALREAVAERVDPRIAHIALCRRVTTFGVYEEMASGDLVAGRTTQTIIYSELENLTSRAAQEGVYETRLAARLEILTAQGASVWTHEEPEIVDRCRRPRRDFFLAQRVALPATLPAGPYVLKVTVEDLGSGRMAESLHEFVILSELALAQREAP